EFADTVLRFVHRASVIILANHGVVSYGETVEKAYWWTEVLDAYCRILMLSKSLGRVNYFTEPEANALLQLKQKWGYADPRSDIENCDICANDVFRDSWKETGVEHKAFDPPSYARSPAANAAPSAPSMDQEALIQTITERVMEALKAR
ncbi:MAG TPA: class II aldolase/adducin family protein, partial [Thermoguttaceae bacterium]|nr:class II aldolase/adducin family protein [Thermoguttaceae bacterium]